jgi:hypothetical protein
VLSLVGIAAALLGLSAASAGGISLLGSQLNSSSGIGVLGQVAGIGVEGAHTAGTGTSPGVYGVTQSTTPTRSRSWARRPRRLPTAS